RVTRSQPVVLFRNFCFLLSALIFPTATNPAAAAKTASSPASACSSDPGRSRAKTEDRRWEMAGGPPLLGERVGERASGRNLREFLLSQSSLRPRPRSRRRSALPLYPDSGLWTL